MSTDDTDTQLSDVSDFRNWGGADGKSGRENLGFISCFNEVDWPPEGDSAVDISFSIPLVSNLLYLLKIETN